MSELAQQLGDLSTILLFQGLSRDAVLAGECVGELSAIDGKPTAAQLFEVPGVIFRNQVLTLPGVAGNLLLALAERMRRANAAALKTQREQLELQHLRRELQIARQLQIDMVPQLMSPRCSCRAW